MPAIAGRKSTFEVSADGNTFVHVDGLVDISFSYNVSEIECTKHSTGLSDAGRREFLPNLEDRTFDISCRWLDGDPGQDIILDAATTKTLFYYRFKMDPLTDIPFIGRAFATSISPTGPLDDTAGVDFSLRCTTLGITPALDLQFADDLSLTDQVTGNNLVTFTRATSATYVGADGLIKTAASGEPRFDHDPVTGESLGLLIEEQRTNLTTYSEQFDDASWTKVGTTITANAAIAPDGATTVDKLITNSGVTGYVSKGITIASATTYTFSVFAKASEIRYLRISGDAVSGRLSGNAYFDLQNGVVSSITSGSASINSVGNGWYRCHLTGVSNSTATQPFLMASSDGISPLTGDGTSGVYIWGAQLEAGAFPTSYIPTTTAAATRNAEGAIITTPNVDSWFVQNDGTWFVDAALNNYDTKLGVMSVNAGAAYVGYGLTTSGSNIALFRRNQPLGASALINTAASIHGEHKFCFCAGSDIGSISADGGAVLSQTSIVAGIDTGLTSVYIGRQYISGDTLEQYINGTIKRIAYYNTRIPNAALQEITIK